MSMAKLRALSLARCSMVVGDSFLKELNRPSLLGEWDWGWVGGIDNWHRELDVW